MTTMSKKEQKKLIDYAQNIMGYMSDKECSTLYEMAKTLKSDEIVVEIGSHQGRSTGALGLGSKFANRSKIYAIDLWDLDLDRHEPQFKDKEFYDAFIKNMKYLGLEDIVIPIKGDSVEIAKTWDKDIKLLFIDGGHRMEDVKRDFEAWYPYVVKSGYIVFHDYHGKFIDIIKYVSSLEGKLFEIWGLWDSLYVSIKL